MRTTIPDYMGIAYLQLTLTPRLLKPTTPMQIQTSKQGSSQTNKQISCSQLLKSAWLHFETAKKAQHRGPNS